MDWFERVLQAVVRDLESEMDACLAGAAVVDAAPESRVYDFLVGDSVFFDVTDANQHPDGTGDSLLFEATLPGSQTFCINGIAGHALTSGNFIVKASELLP